MITPKNYFTALIDAYMEELSNNGIDATDWSMREILEDFCAWADDDVEDFEVIDIKAQSIEVLPDGSIVMHEVHSPEPKTFGLELVLGYSNLVDALMHASQSLFFLGDEGEVSNGSNDSQEID